MRERPSELARGYGKTLGHLHRLLKDCPFAEERRDHAALMAEAEALLPPLRRLVRLQEYGTILHVLSEPVADAPDWMDDIVERLNGRLREIEQTL